MIQIRQMKEEDIKQVSIIEEKTFSLPWKKDDFWEVIQKDNYFYLVACMGEKIVGYCGFNHVIGEGYIMNVAVAEEYRRLGIARKMLKELIERGKEIGVRAFTLEVRKSNEAAIRLYTSLGFEGTGYRKNFYEKPVEDALIMWKQEEL
jgi:ribosomal-protein-alanine N-acetyltransferase